MSRSRNRPRLPVWGAVAWSLIWAAVVVAPAGAQAPPAGPQVVDIAGASYIEFDEAAGIVKAEGRPVIVTRGRTVLRGLRVRYDQRERVVAAEGGVELTEPGVVLSADSAELRLTDDRVRATGSVKVVSTREDQVAELRAAEAEVFLRTRRFTATGGVSLVRGEATLSGRRLDYDDAARVAVVTGEPVARLKEATMTAEIITFLLEQEILRGEGSAQVRRADLAGSARRVEVRSREGIMRLIGDALLVRGRDRLTAAEIEAALDGSRVVTRGNSRAVITPP